MRRFSRDAVFEADYRAAVQTTIDKGYAYILSEEESASAKYFLARFEASGGLRCSHAISGKMSK
jgi:hypothetical protein